jgi:hypothetical protein
MPGGGIGPYVTPPLELSSRLEIALDSYQTAHEYYGRNDIGPNIIIILLDMCDMYLETAENSNEESEAAKTILEASQPIPAGPAQLSSSGEMSSEPPVEAPQKLSTGAQSLPVGALQSLLGSRLALTDAVIDKHGISTMTVLCGELNMRLCKCLLHVMKSMKQRRDYYTAQDKGQRVESSDGV